MLASAARILKIGTIQRRLAWPLRKDDTQIREAFHIKNFFCVCKLDLVSLYSCDDEMSHNQYVARTEASSLVGRKKEASHRRVADLSISRSYEEEEKRLPTSVFWPGEFHGLYSPCGCKVSDRTE